MKTHDCPMLTPIDVLLATERMKTIRRMACGFYELAGKKDPDAKEQAYEILKNIHDNAKEDSREI